MTKMMSFFRVDGGNVYSLGMGHVYRCLKMANLLKKKGVNSSFIMKDIRGGINKVEENGYPVIRLPKKITKSAEIKRLIKISENNLLVIDIRKIDNDYFKQLNISCNKTVYFDDLGGNNLTPDILVNASVTPSLQKYEKKNRKTTYLIGPQFFILGTAGFKRKARIKAGILDVLISLGGADPAGYTKLLLPLLAGLDYDFRLKVVLGPAFRDLRTITVMVRKAKHEIHILKNVDNMGELMFNADIAFVAGGDTALELAYTGTPGLLVPTIHYEGATADYLEKKEIFVSLGDIKKISRGDILKKIDLFWHNTRMRARFSKNARSFIDGRGLQRIVDAIGIN